MMSSRCEWVPRFAPRPRARCAAEAAEFAQSLQCTPDCVLGQPPMSKGQRKCMYGTKPSVSVTCFRGYLYIATSVRRYLADELDTSAEPPIFNRRNRPWKHHGNVTYSCAITPWQKGTHSRQAIVRKALART